MGSVTVGVGNDMDKQHFFERWFSASKFGCANTLAQTDFLFAYIIRYSIVISWMVETCWNMSDFNSRSCGIMDMSGFNAIWEEINTKDSEAISREERGILLVGFVATFRLWEKWTKSTDGFMDVMGRFSRLKGMWSVWILGVLKWAWHALWPWCLLFKWCCWQWQRSGGDNPPGTGRVLQARHYWEVWTWILNESNIQTEISEADEWNIFYLVRNYVLFDSLTWYWLMLIHDINWN